MKNEEKTITYESRDCEHKNLVKIAPLWYACVGEEGCGKIFMVPFTLQYTLELALEHLGKVAGGINGLKDKIMAMRKLQEDKEKEEERKAIEEYKKKEDKGAEA